MGKISEPLYKLGEVWIGKRAGTQMLYKYWWDRERGCTRRDSLGTSELEEAKVALKAWYARNHLPENQTTEDVQLSTVIRTYYEEHAMDLASHEAIRIALTYWLDHFGATSVSQATKPSAIDALIEVHRKKGHSPNYINRILAAGRAAINRAYKKGMLTAAPFVRTVPLGHVAPKGRPLSMEEMRALYHLTDKDYLKRFILWMVGTVARPAALFDLHVSQIDLEHGLVKLNPDGRAQNKKYRPTVKLPKTLHDYVGEGPFLLMNKERRVDDVRYAWRKVRAAAGLGKDVSPYSIRHTMARYLRSKGVPAWEVSAQLGHQQTGMAVTEIYAAFDPAYLATSVLEIDNYLKELLISPDIRPLTLPQRCQCWAAKTSPESICTCKNGEKMVVDTRIELVTPAMSMQCSTAELIDHLILGMFCSNFRRHMSSQTCAQ